MINPNILAAQYAKAVKHHSGGQLAEALTLYDSILQENPALEQVHCNRGVALAAMNRYDQALASFDRALKLNPHNVWALRSKGEVLHRTGRYAAALESFQQAIRVQPDFAEGHYGKGMALNDLLQFEEALRSFEQAEKFQPDNVSARIYQGIMLQNLQRYEEALERFDKVLAAHPELPLAHCNRGTVLQELKRVPEALESFDRAIALAPDFYEGYYNKANALRDAQRTEEALVCFDEVIRLQPGFAPGHNNRGNVLQALGRFEEAQQAFDRALALAPQLAMAYWNKSLCTLLTGQLEKAWPLYEWRKKHFGPVVFPEYAQPLWLGESDIAGKTLFVHFEQGLGDTILFSRYAALAAEKGAKVMLLVQDQLVRLLKNLSPGVTVISNSGGPPAQFDCYTPLISLPMAFKTNMETIPAKPSYLRAEPELVAKWRSRIGADGFKIGIAWQGNKQAQIDAGRSLDLRHFEKLAAIKGVRLISLQKGEGSEQLKDAGFAVAELGADFDAGGDAFVDTAAVMENLDLVITSDTSIAHLAGALGRPTWVALRHVPEWRWFLERGDSPWYPGMRLFRQPKHGDWDSVFAAMDAQLRAMMTAHTS